MIPNWAKGAIVYQIFPDRFCSGAMENNVKTGEYSYDPGGDVSFSEDWYKLPEALDVHRFYGGDLEGVWNKLPYLKKLGVKIILFNPIFLSPSNHKYDTTSYDEIDFHLTCKHTRNQEGTEELTPNQYFAYFVKAVHEAGMKIILDGVFNHCGNENAWYKEGRDEYFCHEQDGSIKLWWGMKTLPKLNYKSEELINEIIRIGVKWVSPPYNCDGWRLDVAADLGESEEDNHNFWKRFYDSVKAANSEAFIFAEHYGDASAWLNGGEWDSVMNYDGFMEPVSWFFTGVDKHCDNADESLLSNGEAFMKGMLGVKEIMPESAYFSALNQLDNHDHARFITRTAGRIGRTGSVGAESASDGIKRDVFMEAVVFQMTWPGNPGIYYGDEVALPGWTDPDNRRTYPWGREDFGILDFYENITRIHNSSPALRYGDVKLLFIEGGLVAYLRAFEKESYIVIINRDEIERDISLKLSEHINEISEAHRIMETSEGTYNVGEKELLISEGELPLAVKKVSSMIIKVK